MAINLLVSGAILLGIEALIPGFGVFGAAGLVCLLGALYFSLGAGTTAAVAVLIALVLLLFAAYVLIRLMPESWLGRRLTLRWRSTAERGYQGSEERKDLLGKVGIAQTVLRPAGKVMIDGEPVDCVTDGEFYEPGTRVKVVAVTGGRTVVRKEN